MSKEFSGGLLQSWPASLSPGLRANFVKATCKHAAQSSGTQVLCSAQPPQCTQPFIPPFSAGSSHNSPLERQRLCAGNLQWIKQRESFLSALEAPHSSYSSLFHLLYQTASPSASGDEAHPCSAPLGGHLITALSGGR